MKRTARNLAVAFLATTIAGWFAWGLVLRIGSGEHGEYWSEWSRTIDVIWVIIPSAFVLSVLCAIAWALAPPRSKRGTGYAIGVLAVTLSVAAWFAFVLTHLHIG